VNVPTTQRSSTSSGTKGTPKGRTPHTPKEKGTPKSRTPRTPKQGTPHTPGASTSHARVGHSSSTRRREEVSEESMSGPHAKKQLFSRVENKEDDAAPLDSAVYKHIAEFFKCCYCKKVPIHVWVSIQSIGLHVQETNELAEYRYLNPENLKQKDLQDVVKGVKNHPVLMSQPGFSMQHMQTLTWEVS